VIIQGETRAEILKIVRARLLLAGATFVGLLVLVAGVLALSGGEDEHTYAAAPARCVEAWNGDPSAAVLGQHQFTYHHYSEVELLILTPAGAEAPETDPAGRCAIAFAASSLDAELAAATLIEDPKLGWTPLSDAVAADRLAQLQADAKDAYNAHLTDEGKIEPL
jgi:hypothetical protein